MNSVLAMGFGHVFFEAPKDATQSEVMNLACEAMNTTGEDVSLIIVFDGLLPKILSKTHYYTD